MTMQMMKMTASTGPTTQIRPSSSSIMGCGSISANITGSEYGLAEYNICKKNHHNVSLGLYEEQKLYLKQFVFNGLSAARCFVKALA